MTRDEVVENIGTIARSGTREFLRGAARARRAGGRPGADRPVRRRLLLELHGRRPDHGRHPARRRRTTATRWESTGDGSYTHRARPSARRPGTTVTLHLKPEDAEDGLDDYTQAARAARDRQALLRLRRVSDPPAGTETLNSMKAIWARPKDEVTEEEYHEFYKHVSHDWNDPLEHLRVHVEGSFEARALLFIPSKAPFDLLGATAASAACSSTSSACSSWTTARSCCRRTCASCAAWSTRDDLSLNVSREILQQDRQIQAIRKHLVRRLLGRPQGDEGRSGPSSTARSGTSSARCSRRGSSGSTTSQERILELVLAAVHRRPGGSPRSASTWRG